MIVLDASAAVELVLSTTRGARVAARLATDEGLHAPQLIDLEVASVLRKLERAGSITAADAESALRDFAALGLDRHDHETFIPRVWALRGGLTVYDACYVAIAEALPATLLTCDAALARARGHHAEIEVV